MNKNGWLTLVVAIVIFGTLIGLLVAPMMLHRDFEYTGSLTFYSEEEYLAWKDAFKNEVATKEGSLINYSVLASEPPIMVSWEVGIPYDQTFSFGGASESRTVRIGLIVFLAVILGTVAAVLFNVVLWEIIAGKDKGEVTDEVSS